VVTILGHFWVTEKMRASIWRSESALIEAVDQMDRSDERAMILQQRLEKVCGKIQNHF
jgi:hypothetical protein